jgi:hypothetical protein
MSIADNVKSDLQAAKKLRMPWWAVLLGIMAAFLCSWLFDNFGRLELVLPVVNSVAVLAFVIVLKRPLWLQSWFWIMMAVIAAVHILLVLLIPWTNKWIPALAIAAIDSADLCVIICIIVIVEKLMKEQNAPRS